MVATHANLTDFDRRYIAAASNTPWWMIVPSWGETPEARAILSDMRQAGYEEEFKNRDPHNEEEEE